MPEGFAFPVSHQFWVPLRTDPYLVLASNVATMVFARTATRENEIAMRFALGSSRGRILAQFFVDALVLALTATVVALMVVAWGSNWITRFAWQHTEGHIPFWLDGGIELNLTTVLWAVALAILASLVAGVVPALKATSSALRSRLPTLLSARLEMGLARPTGDSTARADFLSTFRAAYEELERRLLAEPEVSNVTFATRLPGMDHPQPWVEADGGEQDTGTTEAAWVMPTSIDADFFEAFGADIVAGRGFNSADLASDPGVVVVNEHFVTGCGAVEIRSDCS